MDSPNKSAPIARAAMAARMADPWVRMKWAPSGGLKLKDFSRPLIS